jgi:tRNA-specific 2-thiouridylase
MTESVIHPGAAGRVIVGMSGGVDSSVSALLLKREGLEVSGVFMKNWEDFDPSSPCPAEIDARDALDACDRIGIDLDAVSFSECYRQQVFSRFLDEYRAGRTPNPDVLCNSEIKFRAFLDHVIGQGADGMATGHYAGVIERDGLYRLLRGIDPTKDQSYFLHGLTQEQLARARFPLHRLTKSEVRRLAREAGLQNHAKKDSTGLCFIGERRFRAFLSRYLPIEPGEIRSIDGRILGEHRGIAFYTIGQRQGLGIGGCADGSGEPWYVAAKDVGSNTLFVVQGHDHPLLYSSALMAGAVHWIAGRAPARFRCTAKTRYRQVDEPCTLEQQGNGCYYVVFDRPQWAVTPGQSVVFYQGEECLGGGVIERALERGGSRRPIIRGAAQVADAW